MATETFINPNANPDQINPDRSGNWRKNYENPEEEYETAFQIGQEGHDRYQGKSFEESEANLKSDYEAFCAEHQQTAMPWEQAKNAVQEAWEQAASS
jgi:hypothetical protein